MWMPLGDCPREDGHSGGRVRLPQPRAFCQPRWVRARRLDIAVPIPGTWVTGDFEAGDALISGT